VTQHPSQDAQKAHFRGRSQDSAQSSGVFSADDNSVMSSVQGGNADSRRKPNHAESLPKSNVTVDGGVPGGAEANVIGSCRQRLNAANFSSLPSLETAGNLRFKDKSRTQPENANVSKGGRSHLHPPGKSQQSQEVKDRLGEKVQTNSRMGGAMNGRVSDVDGKGDTTQKPGRPVTQSTHIDNYSPHDVDNHSPRSPYDADLTAGERSECVAAGPDLSHLKLRTQYPGSAGLGQPQVMFTPPQKLSANSNEVVSSASPGSSPNHLTKVSSNKVCPCLQCSVFVSVCVLTLSLLAICIGCPCI
jgi:hypothetical protein